MEYIFVFVIVLGLALYVSFIFYVRSRNRKLILQVTDYHRGTDAERYLILKLIKNGISPKAIFHDLYVPQGRNQYGQIDLVVATRVGLLVFEVKDYSGWIYGTGYKHQWTKVLNYGKLKYKFYNPILQNQQHIKDLRRQSSQFNQLPYYSIIVFDGNCELKNITHIPYNTFVIKSHRINSVLKLILKNEPAQFYNKREVIDILRACVYNGENKEILQEHIHNLNEKLGEERIFR